MTNKKISIHRALGELKTLDSRIKKAIANLTPYDIFKGDSSKVTQFTKQTVDDFKKKAESEYQSIMDLIARKSEIKAKIVHSNSITKVTVAGVEMSVADAITRKDLIEYEQTLLETMIDSKNDRLRAIERNNTRVEENLQKILENTFGKDGVKTDPANVKGISEPFRALNYWTIVEGISEEAVVKLTNEIMEFSSEVDAVLSESNALTFIEL